MKNEGILVAADKNQEWLLPWWWHHYSRHNSYPVAFIDLGMTDLAREWCNKRGTVIAFQSSKLPSFAKETIPLERRNQWEKLFGAYIWGIRNIWFQKPFMLNQTPFETTIWFDIDCMIRGSIETIFQVLRFAVTVCLAKEAEAVQIRDLKENLSIAGETSYNTGVIGYRKEAEFLKLTIQRIFESQNEFVSDQNLVSRIIFEHKIPCFELSRSYNWSLCDGINQEAVVHHYCGAYWKMAILKSLKPNLGDPPTLPPLFDPNVYS